MFLFFFCYDFVRIFYCKFCDLSKSFKSIGKIIVNTNSHCLISDCVFSELWPIFCLPSQNDANISVLENLFLH